MADFNTSLLAINKQSTYPLSRESFACAEKAGKLVDIDTKSDFTTKTLYSRVKSQHLAINDMIENKKKKQEQYYDISDHRTDKVKEIN